jgi:hypothetical protein
LADRLADVILKNNVVDHQHCPARSKTSGTDPGSGRSRHASSPPVTPTAIVPTSTIFINVSVSTDSVTVSGRVY